MSVIVSITETNLEAVAERLGDLRRKAPNACSSALNRTLTNMQTNLKKEIRASYHVKAAAVQKSLRLEKASPSKLSAAVHSSGRPIGMDHFKVAPRTVNPRRKTPIKVAIKKDGMKQIEDGFILNLNGIKVFQRNGEEYIPGKKSSYHGRIIKRGPKKGRYLTREKIDRKFSLSVPQMADDDHIVENVNTKAAEMYQQRLEHEINRLLARIGG